MPADFEESSSSHYESESEEDDLSMSSSPVSQDGEVLENTNDNLTAEIEDDGDVFRITLTKTPDQTDGTFYAPPADVREKVLPTIKEDSESKNTTLSSLGAARLKKKKPLDLVQQNQSEALKLVAEDSLQAMVNTAEKLQIGEKQTTAIIENVAIKELDNLLEKLPAGRRESSKDLKETRKSKKKKDKKYKIGEDE